ncbi:LPXTG cell wall anchor domain-containing protein [uncultured Ruminococcus sp.]|uniref:LPXTG cell wall anchor domain-containing protein n=1 Tax=uncultured Ruminococcus sp. TaxID=165186 RepID=UPI0025FE98EC|nr:LPXTG cell wall anchor domain-containing protein [uncultured Ruminococcus sp.]
MKTTFKKAMAALSAAAVVATCAATMATSVSAAGGTLSVGSTEITLADLKAANYEVTLPISASAPFVSVAFGFSLDNGLTYVDADADKGTCAAACVDGFVWYPIISTKELKAGSVGYVTVKVPETAAEGDTFTLTATDTGKTGGKGTYKDATGADEVPSVVSGKITIAGAPAPVVTTTVTDAPVATGSTTTAAATTTKAPSKAKSTSSPKTGDALPVAGVAVAVAVIGGVALVSKKRK